MSEENHGLSVLKTTVQEGTKPRGGGLLSPKSYEDVPAKP